MIKITPCTPPPFNAAGIEVKALYFSQSPGEKFISVYARYREGQSWAPLHIGLPSIPTLQQVRDLDRNISLDSGSYNNAHIYLRSAAGNNMTTALYTNEDGGGIQVGNVDGLSALNLQPDGGLLTYGGNEVATRNWVNNQGYLTSFTEADPVYTASVPTQLMYKGTIPGGIDLNTYTITGVYHQNLNANAQSGINYPIALAGKLEVVNADNGYMIYQNYTSYHAANAQYYRNYYAGQWGQWVRVMSSTEVLAGTGYLRSDGSALSFDNSTFIKVGVNYGPDMMSVLQNSILYHYGSEPDNPSGGSTGYSINSAVDTISSVQLFVATGAATGYNPDGFFWRGNNRGGPGWPGPWRQVASREWVAANFLSLANVINAQYTSAQNANFWISGSARAQHFVANSLGYTLTAQTGYYGFFTNTGLSTALPVKAKEMVLSDSYSDVAPANGIFVKGSVKTGSLTNGMVKTVAGVLTQAVAGTDYLDTGSVILNQNTVPQAANFNISGNGEIGGNFKVANGVTTLDVLGVGTTPTEALEVLGNIKTNSLAGTGTRSVIANASGILETTDLVKIKKGYITIIGDGIGTVFNIPHGLGAGPLGVSITPKSAVASKMWKDGDGHVPSMSSTMITVAFSVPPANGMNCEFWWAVFA